ncbi:MAG: hypothetical protein WC875_01620 [Candidatus Absconditabacterales bacterium]|jgi:hypothetical protein
MKTALSNFFSFSKEAKNKKRKRLNRPDKNESSKLKEDLKRLEEMADKAANEERQKAYDLKKQKNTICPACRNNSTIVNKIRSVTGEGHISGEFSLGFGSVSGSSSISTKPVNHCNSCGNEWKKTKIELVDQNDLMAIWIYYIIVSIEGKYTFGDKITKSLKDKKFYAETFCLALENEILNYRLKKNHHYTKDDLELSELRKNFKSVYDD